MMLLVGSTGRVRGRWMAAIFIGEIVLLLGSMLGFALFTPINPYLGGSAVGGVYVLAVTYWVGTTWRRWLESLGACSEEQAPQSGSLSRGSQSVDQMRDGSGSGHGICNCKDAT
ncbi:MAG: hypothetical protein KGL39_55000 [Patescibacteria group bacterium]|nr:hypothetical protein [Patescibacteria group bacterium]